MVFFSRKFKRANDRKRKRNKTINLQENIYTAGFLIHGRRARIFGQIFDQIFGQDFDQGF